MTSHSSRLVRRRLVALVAVAAAMSLTLAGCGQSTQGTQASESPERAELIPVSLRLGFIAGAWDVGEFVARDLGFYEEVGLDVTITEGQGSSSNVQLLSNGQVDFAKIAAAALIPAVADGAPLKMVASHLQIQGAGVATAPSIETVDGMSGKSYVGVTHDFGTMLFPAYVDATGITDVEVVSAAPDAIPQVLVSGQADLMVANAWAQVPQLEALGADFNYFPYDDYGVDPLGIGHVTTDPFLEEQREVAEAFAAATMKGWQYVYEHPEEAAEIMNGAMPTIDIELATTTAKMMESFSHTPASEGKPLGWTAEEDWVRTVDLLKRYDLLGKEVPVDSFYTNLIPE